MKHDNAPFEPEDLNSAQWQEVEEAVFAELDADPPNDAPVAKPRRSRAGTFGAVALAAAAAGLALVGARAWPSQEPIPARTTSTHFQGGPEGAELALEDVHLALGTNAHGVVVGGSERGWVVALEGGLVEFTVAPRESRPSFVVQADNVRVEVVGTQFAVNRRPDRVDVEVLEGVVRVVVAGQATLLRQGESWTTHEAAEPPVAETVPVNVDAEDPPRPPRQFTDAQLYERAAGLEARNPRAAARMYRRLVRNGGAWAEAALFALGRLEIESGNVEAGGRSLRDYLRRFPNGINAQDARFLLRGENP